MANEPAGTQSGWRWCANCQSLVYSVFSRGNCFAAEEHDFTGSGEYAVPLGHVPPGAQEDWRWCSQCQCMVYGGTPETTGLCPAGDEHYLNDSGPYAISTPATAALDAVSPRITVDVNGGVIYVRGEGFFPNASARIRFDADGKHLETDVPTNEVGLVQDSFDSRREEGACMVWVHDLTTQKWGVARIEGRRPERFPLDPVMIDPGTDTEPG